MSFASQLKDTLSTQRKFFSSGATYPLSFRKAQLLKLKTVIRAHEQELLDALHIDLRKSSFEAYTSEVGFVYEEINHALKHLNKWAKPKRVSTPWIHKPAKSYVYRDPKGVVLIIGPWNYPIQLVLSPLVGAIAAGNCAVIKPSEVAPHCEAAIAKILKAAFSENYCAVIKGDATVSQQILQEKFDHIFFTGSTQVGRTVMQAAAAHLTPVTLELGGKSPCLIDKDVDLQVTARRIVWGKFYNAGQTCVAPDYLIAHRAIKAPLMQHLQASITEFFGSDPKQSADYGRIINERHFRRLTDIISQSHVVFGGGYDEKQRYIAPTIVDTSNSVDAPAMRDEIFGPILPVLEYDELSAAIQTIQQHPNPLACYVFSKNQGTVSRILEQVRFGGGCINDTLIHLANPALPFGGIGESGLGTYHGKATFDAFSHAKPIVKSPFWADIRLKYPPYGNRLKLVKWLMR